jgi:hypothetical protein
MSSGRGCRALAGVANVLFVLIGARRTFTRHERVFAATFVALSHGLISYALTCKQYSAMLLLLTVSLVACLEVAQTRRLARRLAWWLGLSVTALAWLNSLAVLVFFVFLLVTLWSERAERLKLLRLAAVISLACLPLVYFQLTVLRYTPGDWQKDSEGCSRWRWCRSPSTSRRGRGSALHATRGC